MRMTVYKYLFDVLVKFLIHLVELLYKITHTLYISAAITCVISSSLQQFHIIILLKSQQLIIFYIGVMCVQGKCGVLVYYCFKISVLGAWGQYTSRVIVSFTCFCHIYTLVCIAVNTFQFIRNTPALMVVDFVARIQQNAHCTTHYTHKSSS